MVLFYAWGIELNHVCLSLKVQHTMGYSSLCFSDPWYIWSWHVEPGSEQEPRDRGLRTMDLKSIPNTPVFDFKNSTTRSKKKVCCEKGGASVGACAVAKPFTLSSSNFGAEGSLLISAWLKLEPTFFREVSSKTKFFTGESSVIQTNSTNLWFRCLFRLKKRTPPRRCGHWWPPSLWKNALFARNWRTFGESCHMTCCAVNKTLKNSRKKINSSQFIGNLNSKKTFFFVTRNPKKYPVVVVETWPSVLPKPSRSTPVDDVCRLKISSCILPKMCTKHTYTQTLVLLEIIWNFLLAPNLLFYLELLGLLKSGRLKNHFERSKMKGNSMQRTRLLRMDPSVWMKKRSTPAIPTCPSPNHRWCLNRDIRIEHYEHHQFPKQATTWQKHAKTMACVRPSMWFSLHWLMQIYK